MSKADSVTAGGIDGREWVVRGEAVHSSTEQNADPSPTLSAIWLKLGIAVGDVGRLVLQRSKVSQ